MKPTNFAYYLTNFLSKYLPGTIGLSVNTIMSYRDTFSLFLNYCSEFKSIKTEKFSLNDFKKTLILEYLDWTEKERNCLTSTRNVRLAAFHSFCRYLQTEFTDYIHWAQEILSIPQKKTTIKSFDYLSLDAIKKLFEKPNLNTKSGRRDLTLLSLLYDSGARVQEIIDVKVCDVRLQNPPTVKLTGKGNKSRIVPLMKPMSNLLEQYFNENGLTKEYSFAYPLFRNNSQNNFTRAGVAYIIQKYIDAAKKDNMLLFPKKVSPHSFRHSKAVHLLQSGVNLIYIRDFLGHVDIQTTEIYARIDGEMKRKALENSSQKVVSEKLPEWKSNSQLMDWLKSLGK